MHVATRNYWNGLTLEGLFLLYQQAGIQHSFEFPISSRTTARFTIHLGNDKVTFQNLDSERIYYHLSDLLLSLNTTPQKLMNGAYAFVDNEARCLFRIAMDLQHRATRSLLKLFMSIDGVLSVVFSGPKVVAIVDPKKPNPDFDPLQRTIIRAGNVTFEYFDGPSKDDCFACGTKIVAQNTNPLFQGISDPVLAETGTLGHFISTEMEEELETDEEEEEEATMV